jgi:hypothetical protein
MHWGNRPGKSGESEGAMSTAEHEEDTVALISRPVVFLWVKPLDR